MSAPCFQPICAPGLRRSGGVTTDPLPADARLGAGGFTLVELMIGSTIGSFVLIGILSTFLMLGRSGARLYNYNSMETESRRALEEFSQDVRMASNVAWNSSSSITLTVPDNYASNANLVTYASGSATIGGVTTTNCFFRTPGDITSTATPTLFVHNVTNCTFNRYDRLGNATSTDLSTKRVELTIKIRVTSVTTVAATENAVSATYLLRNKLAN